MVVITESAAKALKDAIRSEGLDVETTFLRVAVKSGGCSGLTYELSFETEQRPGDVIMEMDGVRLLVDGKSRLVLAGTTLDYTSGLNGRGFVLSNPNAVGTCGCGDSFSV